jgi:hypothetical protein
VVLRIANLLSLDRDRLSRDHDCVALIVTLSLFVYYSTTLIEFRLSNFVQNRNCQSYRHFLEIKNLELLLEFLHLI